MPSIEHQKYATQRAKLLFGCYRRSDANEPETYVMAVAAVLAGYDVELIREVTDPRTGISTDERYATWPPNSGELKIYCEGKAAVRARIAQYAQLPRPNFVRLPPPPPRPGQRANCLLHKGSPRYDEMCERAMSAGADPAEFEFVPEGIKVSLTWWMQSAGSWRSLAAKLNPAGVE